MTGRLKETPSQTAGPFVHIGLMPNFLGNAGIYTADFGARPVAEGAEGERITITGRVIDGAGMVLRDAVIESWQADSRGIYPGGDPRGPADPKVTGWARLAADFDSGEWRLETIRPGRVPAADGRLQAPFITLWIVARGINLGLATRLYLGDAAEANADDPVLARIEHAPRRETLIARPVGDGEYRFDIVLQGPDETVFFEV